MAKRLLIAFILLGLVSVAFWWLAPAVGLRLPWYIPLLGFGIIALGVVAPAIAQMPRWTMKTREEEFNTPDPGPSPEDIERFGEPRLRLTDRDE